MAGPRAIYMGPRLRRLRRDLGLTQADMAGDLEISPSYVALLERNQRPLTADLLLRVASTYRIDVADLARNDGAEMGARLHAALRDPIFADLDLPSLQTSDLATNYPGVAEAFLRLHTAYREEQLALADRAAGWGGATGEEAGDPIAEARRFLAARRNCFPRLEEAAQRLARRVADAGGLPGFLQAEHGLGVLRLSGRAMNGSLRRLDRHHRRIFLDEALDGASQRFQLATQLAYLSLPDEIAAAVAEGSFETENGRRLAQRAIASYAAAALLMPYDAFAKAVEERHYDIDALARQFETSFEQTAHRLTTLQVPGKERVPFFFIRVDPAGNVSKRLDGAGFPFARHGGACPLWNVHDAFRNPRRIVTQWLELPDGQRFFSVARAVAAGGGAYGTPVVERAVALGCAEKDAGRLVYAQEGARLGKPPATPIGVTCRLCHRTNCPARAAPPIGRQILADEYRRPGTPFGLSEDG